MNYNNLMDKIIVFYCSHAFVAICAVFIYKRYFMGVC